MAVLPPSRPVVDTLRSVAARVPELAAAPVASPAALADERLAHRIDAELHRYPMKTPWTARVLWLVGGIVGAHRFYLGQTGKALGMLLTGGGLLVWWLADGVRLAALVDERNARQAARAEAGEPPLGYEYVPPGGLAELTSPPEWAPVHPHPLRAVLGLAADLVLVAMAGFVLGALTADGDVPVSGVVAVAAVAAAVVALPLLLRGYHLPFVGAVVRWDVKARLYYRANKPGNALRLLVRPLVGVLYAPFSRRARSEAYLYAEVVGVFAVLAIAWGLVTWTLPSIVLDDGLYGLAAWWIEGAALSFVVIFGFATPIGATLMKHALLGRPAWVGWLVSATALLAILAGLADG